MALESYRSKLEILWVPNFCRDVEKLSYLQRKKIGKRNTLKCQRHAEIFCSSLLKESFHSSFFLSFGLSAIISFSISLVLSLYLCVYLISLTLIVYFSFCFTLLLQFCFAIISIYLSVCVSFLPSHSFFRKP